MAIEKVKAYFDGYGISARIREFPVSSATVELAAKAVGCEPRRIAKTLSFFIEESAVLVVTAGDARIDNKKFKDQFMTKARMMPPEKVFELVGHEIGGVCPFAVPPEVKVYLDVSLKRFATVYPACGSDNSAIALSIPELERYSNYSAWVDVCINVEEK